ncbi:MAG: hypothetical protein WGN25_20620 [Candidatus Electrothrix sp. GW3-4]|uniref:hypothetical protein n=1 Tax=Candidatus Electrothrix sp. GW3-4 TaxID=3126740 RepID=UPI0030D41E10
MNSYELVEIINHCLVEVATKKNFFEAIGYFQKINEKIQLRTSEIISVTEKDKIFNIANSFRGTLNQLISKEKTEINLFPVYDELKAVSELLQNLFKKLSPDDENHLSILSSLDKFTLYYQDHVRLYTPESLHKVAGAAYELSIEYNEIISTLSLVVYSLSAANYQKADNEELAEFIFGNIKSAIDYSIKIRCLIEIYDRVAAKLEINPNHPLKIIKFETGSPWYIKVAGHPITLTIVTNLMIAGAQYIHASYTENSPLNTIPKAAEAADKILKVTSQLKKAGLDVEAQERQVNETISILAKELNALVADQYQMEINGKETKVSGSSDKYLEQARQTFIEQQK